MIFNRPKKINESIIEVAYPAAMAVAGLVIELEYISLVYGIAIYDI
jgi:hypothetical protein